MQRVSPDTPVFAVPDAHLVPVSDHLKRMYPIPPSRMFVIRNSLQKFREKHPGKEVYDASQGDGGASLPGVPRAVLERAFALQLEMGTKYVLPIGPESIRRLIAEQYWQFDPALGWGPQNIVLGAGGRDVLVKAYQAMLALGHGREGDVVVTTRVPWLSYNWGPYGVGANVLRAPGRMENAWAYTPEALEETFAFAARHGRKVAAVIITSPDNPTGNTLSLDEQIALGHKALELGAAFVLYDWIYHHVTEGEPYDINVLLRAFEPDARERIMVLDGITKSLGGSNIRMAWLTAGREVTKFIAARASHSVIPSYFAMAVAQAAIEMGYREAARTIIEPTNASRRWLRPFLEKQGFTFIMGNGYYAFIHVGKWLRLKGWATTEPLGQYLAEEHGLAVVPGVFFSPDGAEWIRFSYAQPPERTQAAARRLVEALQALEAGA